MTPGSLKIMKVKSQEWAATVAEVDACRLQLRECERAFSHDSDDEPTAEFQWNCEYLGYRLRQAHYRMLLLIERAGLPLLAEKEHACPTRLSVSWSTP